MHIRGHHLFCDLWLGFLILLFGSKLIHRINKVVVLRTEELSELKTYCCIILLVEEDLGCLVHLCDHLLCVQEDASFVAEIELGSEKIVCSHEALKVVCVENSLTENA